MSQTKPTWKQICFECVGVLFGNYGYFEVLNICEISGAGHNKNVLKAPEKKNKPAGFSPILVNFD
jgi:hypothetical protein